jgi:hypothetical protein
MNKNKPPRFTVRLQVRVTEAHVQKLSGIATREGNDIASVLRRIIGEYQDKG